LNKQILAITGRELKYRLGLNSITSGYQCFDHWAGGAWPK